MPRVSVIMPVRDGGRHVAAAARSILQQSFADLELVVVDDGSKDDTADVLDSLAGLDARLRVIRQGPAGIVAALETALAHSSGELVARMDADDVSAPRRLELQVAAMTADAQLAAVGSSCIVIDDAGHEIGRMEFPCSPEEIRDRLPTANCLAHPAVTMRRSVLQAVGGYRFQFARCEDYDLWLRIGERHQLANLPEPLLLYRMHRGQGTWRQHRQRFLSELGAQLCASRRRSALPEPPLPADGAVDAAFLERAGMSRSAIAEEVFARALGAAEEGLRRGFLRAAFGALLVAMQQNVSLRRRARMARRLGRSSIRALAGRQP